MEQREINNYFGERIFATGGIGGISAQDAGPSNTVEVFPNPAGSHARVVVLDETAAATEVQLQLTDLSGKVHQQLQLPAHVGSIELELDHLAKGAYILHLSNAEGFRWNGRLLHH